VDSPPVFAQNYGIDNIVYQFEANGVRRMTPISGFWMLTVMHKGYLTA
jgi:hypothetical protein